MKTIAILAAFAVAATLVGCDPVPAADADAPPRVTAAPNPSPGFSMDPATNVYTIHARLTGKRRAQPTYEGEDPSTRPLIFEFYIIRPNGDTASATGQVDQATYDTYHSGDWLRMRCPPVGTCTVLTG